ncbi:hypothetical protein JRO89_XS15G0027600 [Xanthoceras sorbifolium]|uniref:Pectinesterase inhibitor domain-containing protein n=1 Tax=Xanthoceras sorbifolium TaxID=99658 RepID=A0ABQ8H0W7_9ROSI|nr:hypothetical protein JRO89_XS15G0027600 [Xanthoceras sorbifolium]
MESTIDDMENSFDKMGAFDLYRLGEYVHELRIWLSGAITFEESCLDEFENITNSEAGEKMKKILQASRELTSNGLAMVTGISSIFTSLNTKRRLLSDENGSFSDENGYLSWVRSGRRKLLAATPTTIEADVVVAKDGSGQFRTITDALNTVPKIKKTFVIYIKKGVYQKTVMAIKINMTNVMFLGDGPAKSKITAALGANFMAKNMGFENSAEAIKHQAVEFRVQADKSIFCNYQMDGLHIPWDGDFAWYDEYGNREPGAVTWKGIKKINALLANSFKWWLLSRLVVDKSQKPILGRFPCLRRRSQLFVSPSITKKLFINSLKSANTSDPKELIQLGFKVAVNALKEAMKNSSSLKELAKDSRTSQALEDCEELMDSAIDDLQNSFDKLGVSDTSKLGDYVHELKIWLSGAVTFEGAYKQCLAMVSEISSILTSFNKKKRLLYEDYSDQNGKYSDQNGSFSDEDGYLSWVSFRRRKLLATTPTIIKLDAVVAKDGSGQFKTITDALNVVPKKNSKTFVIYIKAGVYQETVMVTKNLTNVMFIGDGPTKTKITENKNYIDGTNTMRTATVSILGPNFIAKDMGFENSAGAIKHQAVALRVQPDKSVFYNCQIDGYQDTLYVHAHTQFYCDCTISGTIDFIFGDAAAVFHTCKMVVRKPFDNQSCIVTAQGRNNSRLTTGIVLQNCIITEDSAYLPVKNYDEYGNRGPGAVQTSRVTWKGIKKVNANQANSFTVAQFVKDDWIKPTGVPYFPGMINV